MQYLTHKAVPRNEQGRDFVLADLHGCYRALRMAMGEVNFDYHKDRLFSVGDIIDRGPESLRCLQLLEESWFYAVQGNHENMLMAALQAGQDTHTWQGWMNNGGGWFRELSPDELEQVKNLLPAVAQLPITMTVISPDGYRFGIAHAEPPKMNWNRIHRGEQLTGDEIWRGIWGRRRVRERDPQPVHGVDATVHGHTIVNEPVVKGNMHFIDTGAYITGRVKLIPLNGELLKNKFHNKKENDSQ